MDFSSSLLASVPVSHSFISNSAHLTGVDFDWFAESMNLGNSKVRDSHGGKSPSFYAHLLTQPPDIVQRSVSINPTNNEFRQRAGSSPAPPASLNGTENPVKWMLYGAGDFQNNQRGESPVSCESSVTMEGMNRACRYNPQEKKERIERYRTKRSRRNFTKKIKYACRKSLADKRPRIRGRFARYNNEEIEKEMAWSHGQDHANGDDNYWINYFFDAANLIP